VNLMSEVLKSDIALANLAIAGAADHTGRYVGFTGFRKIMMVIGLYSEDGIVDSEEVTMTLMEAKDNGGTDEQALIEDIVVTGLVDSTVAVTDLTAGTGIEVDTDTVTVNGVEFAFKAATDVDELEFADGDGLVLCIAAHCPGLVAVNAAEVVTISSGEVGDATVTLAESADVASGWVPAGYTTYATALVEISAEQLSEGFSHVAVLVENGAANDVAAVAFVVRGNPYHAPVKQALAAGVALP
jgi:hypothetical protein